MEKNLIHAIVADAGLLLPKAGTVGLDKFIVNLWIAHTDEEHALAVQKGIPVIRAPHRGSDVGAAMGYLQHEYPGILKSQVFFLCRRINFVGKFTAGAGTTCGQWTRVVDTKGRKGFWKANPATGWCPARCSFCYLLPSMSAFGFQSLALNVGEYAEQKARRRRIGSKMGKIPVINLGETGGFFEWAHYFDVQELVQAYLDATLEAGVTPYVLTKRAAPGLRLAGAHVGVSLNPAPIMRERSPGASTPAELLDFMAGAQAQGASTVIRWGPVVAGREDAYSDLAKEVRKRGLHNGRFTVDLLRFSSKHPATPAGFELRAHKWQERPDVQVGHLRRVKEFFPGAIITGCKLDPAVALDWVRQGVISAMPCACWV